MRGLVYISLVSCLLLSLYGCERSSNTTQPSNDSQAAVSATTAPPVSSPAVVAPVVGEQPAQPASTASPASDKPKFDACSLITRAEIESVQGDSVKETKSDSRSDGGLLVSQCFYSVASFSKSVSLAVTQSDPDNSSKSGARDFWQRTFHRDDEKGRAGEKEKEREGEREREKKKGVKETAQSSGREEEEEGEGTPPKKVTGVGEEAYWMGSRVGGALYVLKKNSFIRISVGGPGNEDEKISKSKALARNALKRL
ncbi:MAG: hypothetical protein QOD00_2786 [Blastocatellia bacterium]|nr:hypothetical protein [Blastocatellia bacterium]